MELENIVQSMFYKHIKMHFYFQIFRKYLHNFNLRTLNQSEFIINGLESILEHGQKFNFRNS